MSAILQHVSKHLCTNALRLSYFCFILLGIYWDSFAVADADDAIPKWEYIKYNSFFIYYTGNFFPQSCRKINFFQIALQFCYWRKECCGGRNEIYYQSCYIKFTPHNYFFSCHTHTHSSASSTSKVVRVVNKMSIGDLSSNKPFHIMQTYDNFLVSVHQFYSELYAYCIDGK